jgi:dTDP-4-dehydrorhamnose reductase
MIASIENHQVLDCDFISHATPILATDLAEIVNRAWDEGLAGVYHIAGAERISPLQFAQRLADHFELPWLALRDEETLNERPTGFGAGETSLQTKTIRKALCVAMPMLSEGLGRLQAQQIDGFKERIAPAPARKMQKVA